MKNIILICTIFISYNSFAQLVGPHCKLKLIKKESNQQESTTYGIGIDGKPKLIAHESKSNNEEVSMLTMAQGLSSQLDLETTIVYEHENSFGKTYQFRPLKSSVKILCKSVRFNSVDLDVEISATEGSSLKTSVNIVSGNRFNLGGLISDSNKKNKTIDISKEASVTSENGNKQFDYFLENN